LASKISSTNSSKPRCEDSITANLFKIQNDASAHLVRILQKAIEVKTITLKGKVSSGEGIGTFFVTLPWARRQFRKKLNFNPYPGTLNLRLSPEADNEELRDVTRGIKIEAPEGFYGGRCFEASVLGKVCGAVVVPDVPDYPFNVLEIIAPMNLREELGLKDGMELTVTVWLK